MNYPLFLNRSVYALNPQDNGGEQILITTEFFDNGDPGPGGIYSTSEISLQSYCNSASISLSGAEITPDALRELADQLEKTKKRAREIKSQTERNGDTDGSSKEVR